MAEIRINATGGVKLYDADDSHYAQIIAGTITSNTDVMTLGHAAVVMGTKLDLNGNNLVLDADADTYLDGGTADDVVDVYVAGAKDWKWGANSINILSGTTLTIDSGATITNSGTASGFGGADPSSADGDTLGTASLEWSDLYLADSSVIYFGADQDTTLTHTDGTGLTLNSTNKLTFGDAASFIQQSSNGVLRIDGEATVDINASAAVTIGVAETVITLGGIPFWNTANNIFTHDVSGTWNNANDNTAIGISALDAITTGDNITVLGYSAGTAITTGNNNSCMGRDSGVAITTGANNTFVGTYSGDRLIDGTGNVCIGYDVDTSASDDSNAIAIGYGMQAASNDFSFGKASNVVTNDFDADADWARSSDERLKRNIEDSTLGLDFINDLRSVKFQWKPSYEVPEELTTEYNAENQKNLDVIMHGFIAQEVKEAIDTHGDTTFGGWQLDKVDGVTQRTKKNMFIMPLVKAVQELSAKNAALEARIEALEG